jgi:hypothetical protein
VDFEYDLEKDKRHYGVDGSFASQRGLAYDIVLYGTRFTMV